MPSITDTTLAPAGMDIRDMAIGNDNKTIYAVTGDSLAAPYNVYKSVNAGVSWTALPISIRPDLIAVAPDNVNLIAIANNSTPEVYFSLDGGTKWNNLGVIQDGAEAPAAGIKDIAISPERNGKRYIMAAGWEAGNTGNAWYFPFGELFNVWHETNTLPGFTAEEQVSVIAFSPSFSSDGVIAAVTGSSGAGVNLQLFSMSMLSWNANAAYDGYPAAVTTAAGLTAIISASITLATNYDAQDEDFRRLFIGLTLNGDADAIAASGIYRFNNSTRTVISPNKKIHSLSFYGSNLIAGSYNDTTVYRIQSALTVTPDTAILKTPVATKYPGGENQVVVAWMGSTIAAGTGGNESAFCISKDTANTFNDISLIDTVIINARDIAVTTKAGKVYLTTDDGIDTSLWYKYSNVWTRVYSLKGSLNYIVRAERINGNIVYLAQKGTTTIYYNENSGSAQWLSRNSSLNVQDITVESAGVAYVLDGLGKVRKTSNAGQNWSAVYDTTLASGNMICNISSGNLLAGSQNGFIAYSTDGAATWTKIPQPLSVGAGRMHVVPDANYTSNKVIYAASQSIGQDIKKWKIGTSTEWTDIFQGTAVGGVYGLAVDHDTLYALEYEPGINQSTLWRFITPINATATSPNWVGITTTSTTDSDDANVQLNSEPQALKVSDSKLWAVKTNGVNKLYSFTDSVAGMKIILSQPQDRATVSINSISGIAYDIALSWERPSITTQYELNVSPDPEFMREVSIINVTSSASFLFCLIGPGQPGVNYINFNPGETYYWRVRTSKPGYSLFSESRSFAIGLVPVSAETTLQLLGPSVGSTIEDTTPAFSWHPVTEATEYEFMLSENIDMSTPIIKAKVDTTGILLKNELINGKTYFWQVRAVSPVIGEWSPIGIFNVAEKAPPPTTQEVIIPTYTINLPATTQISVIVPPLDNTTKQTAPGYVVLSIFILLALTGTVGFLIIKQPGKSAIEGHGTMRRPAALSRQNENLLPKIENSATPTSATGVIPDKSLLPQATPKAILPTAENRAPVTIPSPDEKHEVKPLQVKSKDAQTIIFAAKSFMWLAGAENDTTDGIPDKERKALGKKLAANIRELAKKEPIYVKHPEDAAMLLQLWARYGSRDETAKYMADSLKSRPENALRLLKCFIPQENQPGKPGDAGVFDLACYKALTGVMDADKVYAALTKASKFKLGGTKEAARMNPADSNLVSQFMNLHLQSKKAV